MSTIAVFIGNESDRGVPDITSLKDTLDLLIAFL